MWFTRKGDGGTTGLPGGKRVHKSHAVIEALGALDELNSFLGVCRAECPEGDTYLSNAGIEALQQQIFIVQAEIAALGAVSQGPHITEEHVKKLETLAERIEKDHPPITSFLVPGATVLSARLDYARAVARRAERRVGVLRGASPHVLSYMNRLSSVLYALARHAAHLEKRKESAPRY